MLYLVEQTVPTNSVRLIFVWIADAADNAQQVETNDRLAVAQLLQDAGK